MAKLRGPHMGGPGSQFTPRELYISIFVFSGEFFELFWLFLGCLKV